MISSGRLFNRQKADQSLDPVDAQALWDLPWKEGYQTKAVGADVTSVLCKGKRSSLIAALIINLFFLIVIPIGTLVVYCPSPCRTLWLILELANWINFLFGILATVALAFQLRQYRGAE